jgi:anti-anti-sigma factor
VTELVEIRLIGVPVQIHEVTSEHGDALRRELALVREAAGDEADLPDELRELVAQLIDRFSAFTDDADRRLAEAVTRGEATVDLTFRVPPEVREGASRLMVLLDEADAFCRSGRHLLTLVAPPEVVAYRRWFLGQFVAQADGADPVPWSDDFVAEAAAAAERAEAAEHAAPSDTSGPTAARTSAERSVVLRYASDIDAHTAPELREELQQLFADHPTRVVLDLSDVEFIDSVGIGVVLAAIRRLSEWDGHLTVRASAVVRRTLSIAGLESILDDSADAPPDLAAGADDPDRTSG